MKRHRRAGARQPWQTAEVFSRTPGPLLRASRENQWGRERVIGQWGPAPWFAKAAKLTCSTHAADRSVKQHDKTVLNGKDG